MIELQNLDCNCNDCFYLQRSLAKRQEHIDFHYQEQKKHFNTKRIKLLERGEYWLFIKKDKKKAKLLFNEARKMLFVFSEGPCSLSYGKCILKKINISFIVKIMMEENFNCFKHRLNE